MRPGAGRRDGMNTIQCTAFVELVTAFLDGALDTRTERLFLEHVGLCEGCGRYLDQMRQVVHTLRITACDREASPVGFDAFAVGTPAPAGG